MQLQIDSYDPAKQAQLEQLLALHLAGHCDGIQSVTMRIARQRDASGQMLCTCRVRTRLANGQGFDVCETQADSDAAIGRALGRTARAVRRHVSRQSSLRHIHY